MFYRVHNSHDIIKLGKTGFSYCWRCGVVCLKNRQSKRYFRKECGDKDW